MESGAFRRELEADFVVSDEEREADGEDVVEHETCWAEDVIRSVRRLLGSTRTIPPAIDFAIVEPSALSSVCRASEARKEWSRAFFFPEKGESPREIEANDGEEGGEGIVVVLSSTTDPDPASVRRDGERDLLRVALEIETSYRLKTRPEVVKAVLDPSSTTSTAREEGVELWPALVAGKLSLIERGQGEDRRYVVVENPAAVQPLRALTQMEQDVVSRAARGLSTKMIAYALGITSPTVSTRLGSAASKMGASTRTDIVRLAATFTRDPESRFPEKALTAAERDVLSLIRRGMSNEEIATIRARSIRTVANQVASLLRKTQSNSRRGLAVV